MLEWPRCYPGLMSDDAQEIHFCRPDTNRHCTPAAPVGNRLWPAPGISHRRTLLLSACLVDGTGPTRPARSSPRAQPLSGAAADRAEVHAAGLFPPVIQCRFRSAARHESVALSAVGPHHQRAAGRAHHPDRLSARQTVSRPGPGSCRRGVNDGAVFPRARFALWRAGYADHPVCSGRGAGCLCAPSKRAGRAICWARACLPDWRPGQSTRRSWSRWP